MTLDDVRSQWQESNRTLLTRAQRDELIGRVQKRAEKFGSEIFCRDAVETIVGGILAVFFGRMLFGFDQLLAKVGAGMAVASVIFILYRLHRTRTAVRPSRPEDSVREFCVAEIERIDRQIGLLRSVAWWYLAPCLISANVVFLGFAGFGWVSAGYFVVTMILGWGVYRLNQHAVRKSMRPMREELDALLTDLTHAES